MRPAPLLQWLCGLWAALAVAACFWSPAVGPWLSVGVAIGAVATVEHWRLRWTPTPEVERDLPSRFALDVESSVNLTVHNTTGRRLRLAVFDGIPPTAESEALPIDLDLPEGRMARVAYDVRLRERGTADFGATELLLQSPWGLWHRRRKVGEIQTVRIYPNYEPVVRYALLAIDNHESQMGIVMKNRQGASREFHQLRDYRQGDLLTQIDWKATSRRRELISREYREQRDQTIFFLIDSGRRMRAMDGHLSQFDHCLNATLLLSYIALRQGDHVGVLGFGGNRRWLPPVRGGPGMTALLNHLYDYQPTLQASDFHEAARDLMVRQKRRALVVVLTNLRGEDAEDVSPALDLMRRRHLVLLTSLRERQVEQLMADPIHSLEDASAYGAAAQYLEERGELLNTLDRRGVLTIDETAQRLPIALANRYLQIKRSGQL